MLHVICILLTGEIQTGKFHVQAWSVVGIMTLCEMVSSTLMNNHGEKLDGVKAALRHPILTFDGCLSVFLLVERQLEVKIMNIPAYALLSSDLADVFL